MSEYVGKFWMVYVEEGGGPRVKHLKYLEADAEAKRLAGLTGKPAYILEATMKLRSETIIHRFILMGDGI